MTIKAIKFRIVDILSNPVTWARIKAELVPDMTYGDAYNTVFPKEAVTHTNGYGIATLYLKANDALEIPDSKYLITISKDGKTFRFLVRLTIDMPDSLDFEELLKRNELAEKSKECAEPGESSGRTFLHGGKLYL